MRPIWMMGALTGLLGLACACSSGNGAAGATEADPAGAAAPADAAPTGDVMMALSDPNVIAAGAIQIRPVTAADSNLPLAQVVDVDGYLSDPATQLNFSAASHTANCAPAMTSLKYQLPKTIVAVAAAAAVGAVAGAGVAVLTGSGWAALLAGAVGAGAVGMAALIKQLPGLTVTLRDVAACGANVQQTKLVQSALTAGAAVGNVPTFDPNSPACLVVRLNGHMVTDCPFRTH